MSTTASNSKGTDETQAIWGTRHSTTRQATFIFPSDHVDMRTWTPAAEPNPPIPPPGLWQTGGVYTTPLASLSWLDPRQLLCLSASSCRLPPRSTLTETRHRRFVMYQIGGTYLADEKHYKRGDLDSASEHRPEPVAMHTSAGVHLRIETIGGDILMRGEAHRERDATSILVIAWRAAVVAASQSASAFRSAKAMAPLAMSSPTYKGPKALGFSKYASPTQVKAQLPAEPAICATVSSTPGNSIATKQQIAALASTHEATSPAAELAVEQGTALKKEVEDHTAKFSQAVSSAVTNTRQLLSLLRASTPGSDVVENLWKELEQLFEAANTAKVALPDFMEKQRDNMSLYHSSMMNETIRETREELQLQHKKVNTQHNLILEQQDAFQNYKVRNASKLKELESLQERVSRLTLEKGNFRTEVDKYKDMLEEETKKSAEDLATTEALQKELEILVSSKKQLQVENETLRKTATDMLEQIKKTEQRVTDRFTKELVAKSEELQQQSTKSVSLNALINTLNSDQSTTKKELDKIKNEHRLLSIKYGNQTSEHAKAFTDLKDQIKKTETLNADIDRLREQNADLQSKVETAAKLSTANTELSNEKQDLQRRLKDLVLQLNDAKDGVEAAQSEVQTLKLELASKQATPAASDDKAALEKIKDLEDKRDSLEGALAEWTELAKRSYKEYKDILPKYKEAEKYRKESQEKEMEIIALKQMLDSAKASQPNGVGAAAGGDSAYWKQKYETLLSSL
ncbi:hypothetical protein OPT61_g6628 [Boeremia exigua]|uniref:Uncharacterized protein n=1 Tax=Boeremia exigua TaxID=749465 RepID=A0ACC2I5L2_9PLEO|nr:hypothetical protein OPT61_g6628 [Boeremia exigua]